MQQNETIYTVCQPVPFSYFPRTNYNSFPGIFSQSLLYPCSILALALEWPTSEVFKLTADFHLSNLLLITFNGVFRQWTFSQIFNFKQKLIWCRSRFSSVLSSPIAENCGEIGGRHFLLHAVGITMSVFCKSYRASFPFNRNTNTSSS